MSKEVYQLHGSSLSISAVRRDLNIIVFLSLSFLGFFMIRDVKLPPTDLFTFISVRKHRRFSVLVHVQVFHNLISQRQLFFLALPLLLF